MGGPIHSWLAAKLGDAQVVPYGPLRLPGLSAFPVEIIGLNMMASVAGPHRVHAAAALAGAGATAAEYGLSIPLVVVAGG